MYTDPIADLLTRIRNAQQGRKDSLVAPHSTKKVAILEVLKANGFIVDFQVNEIDSSKKEIAITLDLERYPVTLKRVSKPGQRIYMGASEIKTVKSGLGINIISTSKGVMTGKEARDQKLGGELICQVY